MPPICFATLAAMQGTERTDEHLNIFLEYVAGGTMANIAAGFGEQQPLQDRLCNA